MVVKETWGQRINYQIYLKKYQRLLILSFFLYLYKKTPILKELNAVYTNGHDHSMRQQMYKKIDSFRKKWEDSTPCCMCLIYHRQYENKINAFYSLFLITYIYQAIEITHKKEYRMILKNICSGALSIRKLSFPVKSSGQVKRSDI